MSAEAKHTLEGLYSMPSFRKFCNAHGKMWADEYRENASDSSVAKNALEASQAEKQFRYEIDSIIESHAANVARIAELEASIEMLLVSIEETGNQYLNLEVETWLSVQEARALLAKEAKP